MVPIWIFSYYFHKSSSWRCYLLQNIQDVDFKLTARRWLSFLQSRKMAGRGVNGLLSVLYSQLKDELFVHARKAARIYWMLILSSNSSSPRATKSSKMLMLWPQCYYNEFLSPSEVSVNVYAAISAIRPQKWPSAWYPLIFTHISLSPEGKEWMNNLFLMRWVKQIPQNRPYPKAKLAFLILNKNVYSFRKYCILRFMLGFYSLKCYHQAKLLLKGC